MAATRTKKDWLTGLSLANLLLYAQWAFLDTHSSSLISQYQNASPFQMTYLAMILNVLMLGLATGAFCYFLCFHHNEKVRKFSRFFYVALFILSLNNMRIFIGQVYGMPNYLAPWFYLTHYGKPMVLTVGFGLLGLLAAFIIKTLNYCFGLVRFILLIFFPLCFVHGGWVVAKVLDTKEYATTTPAPITTKPKHPNRVVWFVFDTLEQRSGFTQRHPSVKMPALDRFWNESFVANNAYPPGVSTMFSISSYLTGTKFTAAAPLNGVDMMVRIKGREEKIPFSTMPNIMDEARSKGHTTGIVGWHHPYCRLLRRSLDKCSYHSLNQMRRHHPTGKLKADMGVFLSQVIPSKKKYPSIEGFHQLFADAKSFATDPNLSLSFLHFGLPHKPWIYDRKTKKVRYLGEWPQSLKGYWGNLELTDKSFGEIREAMEQKGLWENTTVIVTSDHWWWFGHPENQVYQPDGKTDFRIPLIIKLPHQKQHVRFDPSMNTVLLPFLVMDVLEGRVENIEDLSRWFDSHAPLQDSEPIMETNVFG